MTNPRIGALVVSFALASAGDTFGLERVHSRAAEYGSAWSGGNTTTLSYFNVCNEWTWTWLFYRDERLGVCFESPIPDPVLVSTTFVFDGTSHSGYGHTGTVAVYAADALDCPTGGALASSPYLPVDGAVTYEWDIPVPTRFVVLATTDYGIPVGQVGHFRSDHPAHGPTGPPACGTCFPENRDTHSFYYGTVAQPLCPGTPLFDGLCNAELMWTARLQPRVTSVDVAWQQRTWSSIKALYR
jgi:hypothetical protein